MNNDVLRHLQSLATYPALMNYLIGELEAAGFGTDAPIDGSDLVEAMGNLYEQLCDERARTIAAGLFRG